MAGAEYLAPPPAELFDRGALAELVCFCTRDEATLAGCVLVTFLLFNRWVCRACVLTADRERCFVALADDFDWDNRAGALDSEYDLCRVLLSGCLPACDRRSGVLALAVVRCLLLTVFCCGCRADTLYAGADFCLPPLTLARCLLLTVFCCGCRAGALYVGGACRLPPLAVVRALAGCAEAMVVDRS